MATNTQAIQVDIRKKLKTNVSQLQEAISKNYMLKYLRNEIG